jgi:hypothetical protein
MQHYALNDLSRIGRAGHDSVDAGKWVNSSQKQTYVVAVVVVDPRSTTLRRSKPSVLTRFLYR